MIKKLSVFIIGFVVILSSCTNEVSNLPQNRFFSIKDYFEKEIHQYSYPVKVKKKVVIEGKEEIKTIQFDSTKLKEEFALFIASDINRPAWLDRYQVDSVFVNSQLSTLTYQALDKKLKTQNITIAFEANKVSRIDIFQESESAAAYSKKELTYSALQSYNVKSVQKLILSDERTLKTEVIFLR